MKRISSEWRGPFDITLCAPLSDGNSFISNARKKKNDSKENNSI